jgi:hypothetical protein
VATLRGVGGTGTRRLLGQQTSLSPEGERVGVRGWKKIPPLPLRGERVGVRGFEEKAHLHIHLFKPSQLAHNSREG